MKIHATRCCLCRREMKAEMKNLISDGDYGDTLDIYEDIYNMTLSVRSVVVEDEAQYENLRLDGQFTL